MACGEYKLGKKEYMRLWRLKNKDRVRENHKRWCEENPERRKEHHAKKSAKPEYKQKAIQRAMEWKRKNPGKARADTAAYRAAKDHRTPPWSDLKKIQEYYIEAQRLTAETGVTYSVDHIIPLRGERVSGLHVPENLQVIPLQENATKGNSFDTGQQYD